MAKILIIDDEPDFLDLLCKVLARTDHEITAISDGAQVLEGQTGADFDLVVTDIIMPGVEGIETLAYFHRINPDIKLVAISGGGCFDASFHLKLARDLGAVRTLEKPFDVHMFLALVEEVLEEDRTIGDAIALDDPAPEARTPDGKVVQLLIE
jgi:DNA-binding NtrC family response regulator